MHPLIKTLIYAVSAIIAALVIIWWDPEMILPIALVVIFGAVGIALWEQIRGEG